MNKDNPDLLPDLNISAATRARHHRVVADRRTLHRIPEEGLELPRTAAFIEEELDEVGVPHSRPIDFGVVGLIGGEQPGPTVMLRADMRGKRLRERSDPVRIF